MDTKTKGERLRVQVAEDESISLPAEILREMGVKEGDMVYLWKGPNGSLTMSRFSNKEAEALEDAEAFMDANPTDFEKLAE